jgi:hypothetical protein
MTRSGGGELGFRTVACGQWWGVDRARWVAVVDDAIELEPTRWMAAPADPE